MNTHTNYIIHDNNNILIGINDINNTIQTRIMHVDWRNSRNVERNENLEGRITCGQQIWARVIPSLARQRGEQPFACVVGLRQPLACTRFDCGDLGVPGVGVAVGASRVWPSNARGLTQHARAGERNEQANALRTCERIRMSKV